MRCNNEKLKHVIRVVEKVPSDCTLWWFVVKVAVSIWLREVCYIWSGIGIVVLYTVVVCGQGCGEYMVEKSVLYLEWNWNRNCCYVSNKSVC